MNNLGRTVGDLVELQCVVVDNFTATPNQKVGEVILRLPSGLKCFAE